jgi:hypothetical protein
MGLKIAPLTNMEPFSICFGGAEFSPTILDAKGLHMNQKDALTLSVPEAGKRYFGLCRNSAYEAAARGDIPTIKIGRLLRVPVRALERMLDRAGEPAA